MDTHSKTDVQKQQTFLTLALDGREQSAARTSHFNPPKGPLVPTEQEFGWAQGWSEHFGEEKNFLPLLQTNCHITQLIAQS
jgi:hypothetical protein